MGKTHRDRERPREISWGVRDGQIKERDSNIGN
jgi:hypothetical protein